MINPMILFLDFDGVLHPSSVFLEKGRPVLRGEGELFMWAPYLIEALAPHPHVKIVLSTNWVRMRDFSRVKSALPKALRDRVIGATWHSSMLDGDDDFLTRTWYDDATRYEQIIRHVARANISQWIAIDDLHENTETWHEAHDKNFILTDPQKGLSDPMVLTRIQRVLHGTF